MRVFPFSGRGKPRPEGRSFENQVLFSTEQAIQRHRADDEDTHHDLLVVGLHVHEIEDVADHTDDQATDDDALNLAAPAEEAGTANDG